MADTELRTATEKLVADLNDNDIMPIGEPTATGLFKTKLAALKAFFQSGVAVLPSFVGNAGKALLVNGTEDGTEWGTVSTGGGGGGGGSGSWVPPRTRLGLTADQALPSDGAWHAIAWNREDADDLSGHESVTHPERITVPAGVTAIRLLAHIIYSGVELGTRQSAISKNGANYSDAVLSIWPARSWVSGHIIDTGWIECAPGDYYTVISQSTQAVYFSKDGVGPANNGCFVEALFDDSTAGGSGGGSTAIGTHRYWGLFNMTGANPIQIQAIHWNLASVTTYPTHYHALSTFGGGYVEDNLLDDTGSYFAGNSNPLWIYADFTTPVGVDEITMEPVSGNTAYAPNCFTVCYSDDGKNWNIASLHNYVGWADATFVSFTVPTTR